MTIKKTETENTVQFELTRGTNLRFNKDHMGDLGEAMEHLARLEKAFQRIMPISSDEIADILEARQDGRLTIWPKLGQELWFDATGMCERCPYVEVENCEACHAAVETGSGDLCPPYVSSEPWLGDDDDQREAFLNGEYRFTKEAAEEAFLNKEDETCERF